MTCDGFAATRLIAYLFETLGQMREIGGRWLQIFNEKCPHACWQLAHRHLDICAWRIGASSVWRVSGFMGSKYD